MCHSPACGGDHCCCHSGGSGSVPQKAVKVQVCVNTTPPLHTHNCQLLNLYCVEGMLSLYRVLCLVHCGGIHTYTLLSAVCVPFLLCRPNRPLPNPVYEYECMGSGSGGVALASMTENPAYVTAAEAITSFSSGPEEDKEKDHTYEVFSFEAN